MAEDLREVARKFREGMLVQTGEPQHAIMETGSGDPPALGQVLAGPSRIVSVSRRQDGRWDIEFVELGEPERPGS